MAAPFRLITRPALWASLAFWATIAAAAPPGKIAMEKVEYKGWKHNLKIANAHAELIVTLDVGPRVISYRTAGGKNVFKEYADQLGKTRESEWQIRGGHRFWVGPEDLTRCYFADNGPVVVSEPRPGVYRFTPGPETQYGIQKELEIALDPGSTRVTVTHRVTNIGDRPTELAPWGLSVMAPGGMEIIPMPPAKPHPGSPKNAKSPADFAPDRRLILWPFFDFTDTRWRFGSKYITLTHDAKKGPTKLGLTHKLGWVGYLNDGTLFVKRFGFEDGVHYPDTGANYETFSNEDMVEVESLGPLTVLEPGHSVDHVEHWELLEGLGSPKTDAEIDASVLPKVAAGH